MIRRATNIHSLEITFKGSIHTEIDATLQVPLNELNSNEYVNK